MSERFIVDVGAQYIGPLHRIAVLDAGGGESGTFALVSIGSYPTAQTVRLSVGTTHALTRGGSLRLVAFNDGGRRGAVALELVP